MVALPSLWEWLGVMWRLTVKEQKRQLRALTHAHTDMHTHTHVHRDIDAESLLVVCGQCLERKDDCTVSKQIIEAVNLVRGFATNT